MTQWLTQKEAAEYLRLNKKTFGNYVSRGHFTYYTHPQTRTRRFKAQDLDESMVKCPCLPELTLPQTSLSVAQNKRCWKKTALQDVFLP